MKHSKFASKFQKPILLILCLLSNCSSIEASEANHVHEGESHADGEYYAHKAFISEYAEGTENNKAIEIFNSVGEYINLSDYTLQRDNDGDGNFNHSYNFSGGLAPGDAFVLKHSQATALSSLYPSEDDVMDFDGNDQIRLLENSVEIDRIGIPGGVFFGEDITLIRHLDITSAEISDEDPRTNGQWTILPVDSFQGLGLHTWNDLDEDGICDHVDNCLGVKNIDQGDMDGDEVGNKCDNCPSIINPDQEDSDGNGLGDACEIHDVDGDGIPDNILHGDNCPIIPNLVQLDTDNDGVGDYCDNCFLNANNDQLDSDSDGMGDTCDNCQNYPNPNQLDMNFNGQGDMCEDPDGDGIPNGLDNCITHSNPNQEDLNNNGMGDVCEDENDGWTLPTPGYTEDPSDSGSGSNSGGNSGSSSGGSSSSGGESDPPVVLSPTESYSEFSSSSPVNLSNVAGVLPRPVKIKDSLGKVIVQLSKGTRITETNGDLFTGTIYTPKMRNIRDFIAPKLENITMQNAFEISSSSNGPLNFSNPGTFTIPLPRVITDSSQKPNLYKFNKEKNVYEIVGNGGELGLDGTSMSIEIDTTGSYVLLDTGGKKPQFVELGQERAGTRKVPPVVLSQTESYVEFHSLIPINLSEVQGILPRPIMIEDAFGRTTIQLQKGTRITDSNGSPFTETIYTPKMRSVTEFATPKIESIKIQNVFELSSSNNEPLSFSKSATFTIPLPKIITDISKKPNLYKYDKEKNIYTIVKEGGILNPDGASMSVQIDATGTYVLLDTKGWKPQFVELGEMPTQTASNVINGIDLSQTHPSMILPQVIIPIKDVSSIPPISKTPAPDFGDIKGHWAEYYIEQLRLRNVVEGKEEGFYDPDSNTTRAEITKIALNAFSFARRLFTTSTQVSDVSPEDWYAPYIEVAKEKGIIQGYADGTFKPNQSVSRAEAVKIILVASGLDINAKSNIIFADVPHGIWYEKYVNYAYQKGFMEAFWGGNFMPDQPITRAEMAKVVVRIWEIMSLEAGGTKVEEGVIQKKEEDTESEESSEDDEDHDHEEEETEDAGLRLDFDF